MNSVLIQVSLSEKELAELIEEFPQYLFIPLNVFSYKKLERADWSRVEILFGDQLTEQELEMAPQLRWIHTQSASPARLCVDKIIQKELVVVTVTKEENVTQIGEFVMGAILAFAKNLFVWSKMDHASELLWISKDRDTLWKLEGRILLQIGLGRVGGEICLRAKEMGMRVFGVDQTGSFHPHCHKTFRLDQLAEALPLADVVTVALPQGERNQVIFTSHTLDLMRQDAIFIVIGNGNMVDEEALAAQAKAGKFRGVLIDAEYEVALPANSKLWQTPKLILTPAVASRPKSHERGVFHLFRHNLRQYIHGNLRDMAFLWPLK